MRVSSLKYAILTSVSSIVLIVLLLMPFHAFLTVWLSQVDGHYTALRLWKEVLLLVSGLGVLLLLVVDHKIRSHTLSRRLVQLCLLFIVVNFIWGIVAFEHHNVTAKALGYGWITDLRMPLFFLIAWAVSLRTKRLQQEWRWAILVPFAIVAIFALVQEFFLTPRFLEHFGYSKWTILPSQFVNNNHHFLRVQATLRGANPLGAYLLVPLTLLTLYMMRGKRHWRYVAMLVAGVGALYFSFSRAAWLGFIVILVILAALEHTAFVRRHIIWMIVAAALVISGLVIGVSRSTKLQNVVLHTQQHSKIKDTSDAGHVSALRSGWHDLVHEPLGRGPGTAGPASVYNKPHSPRIAENFFIQIAQETGWIGLALFLLINAGIGYLLWCRRADPLAMSLFASLIGLSVVNMLSHAWADDTLAYLWWGLAGVAMAPVDQKKAKRHASA
jgi:hypothetical protein